MPGFLEKLAALLKGKRYDMGDSITYMNKSMGGDDKAELCRIKGQAMFKKGDHGGALKQYDKAIAFYSESAHLFSERGDIHEKLYDLDSAIQDYESALKLEPNNAKLLSTLGELTKLAGRTSESTRYLDRANELCAQKIMESTQNLESSLSYVQRGNQKMEEGDYEGALYDFDQAIQMDPRCYEAFLGRGSIRQSMKDTEGAREDFNMAQKIDKKRHRD